MFLESARERLFSFRQTSNSGATVLNVCLGNEAADADSLISTLCYAFLRQCNSSTRGENVIYIPAAAIPRADLTLRRDVELLVCMINYNSIIVR